MRIVHICTQDSGGAGTAALRLHLGLKSIGVESKMLVLDHKSSDSDVVKFTRNNHILRQVWNKVWNKLIWLEFDAYKNTRPKGLDLFTDDRAIYALSKHPLIQEADIIHLHWIATMVNYSEFFSNVINKPLIWTLHDMNPFTGGCHYSNGCAKYETGCGACPQLGSKDPSDLSRKIFKRKEKTYKGKNIHILTPSKWLRDCAKRSILFKNFPIDVIPNGILIDIFKKRDKSFSRDLLNLPQDKTIILFGADYGAERKGFKYLIQALKLLKDKIDTLPKVALVTFGHHQSIAAFSKDTGFSIYQLGYMYDEPLLSCVYSAADIFIIPSLEENLPNTMLESMACGTPVVAFRAGGIPDMITPHKTGLLAELKNTKDLTDKIEYMITHPQERQQMGQNARKLVEEEYTLRIQAKRYLELYEKAAKK